MQQTKINNKEVENVKNFGVELELIAVDKSMLVQALHLKGISCEDQTTQRYSTFHNTQTFWKIVTDGSVAGSGSCELVSPILNGLTGLKQLREVCLTLYFIGAKINKSCGLHIHHESGNLTTKQMKNLVKFYARMERTIDAFMAKSRKRNNGSRYVQSMINLCHNIDNGHLRIEDMSRYHKLNLQSYYRQGTIEFRQHQGTIEFEKIYHWVVFTAQFLEIAKNKTSTNMNFIERAWTPKHLKLQKRTWTFFKARMKKLDDLARDTGTVEANLESLMA